MFGLPNCVHSVALEKAFPGCVWIKVLWLVEIHQNWQNTKALCFFLFWHLRAHNLCSDCLKYRIVSNRSPGIYFLTVSLASAVKRDGCLLINFQHLRLHWASKRNGHLFGVGAYSRQYSMRFVALDKAFLTVCQIWVSWLVKNLAKQYIYLNA